MGAGAVIGGIAERVGAGTGAAASGQSGWQLVRTTLIGAGTGAVVGALTLKPAAAAAAGSSLIAGTVGKAMVGAGVAGALGNTADQLATIALDPCAKFSPLQVGLSAIPGPFSTMNSLAIASRYRTGNIAYTVVVANIATGVQLGTLGP